ncbi:MAG: hypothetical protein IAI48_00335, partial [Candidatus Eremiobacteraeota bacterium]|nr:hypothetical protein [Candidatus Eremiobacteraeota bacterium]
MSTTGGFDGDSLDIFVRGHDEASSTFQSAWDAAERAGAGITNANAKIEQSARSTASAVGATTKAIEDSGSRVVEVGAKQQRVLDDLKSRFAGIGEAAQSGARAAAGDLEALNAQLDSMKRALQALRDDARTGAIAPQQRVNVLESMRTQALGGDTRENLQSRFQSGDAEGRARYTQLVAIERELQTARRQTAEATKAAATEEAQAEKAAASEINESVRQRTTELRDQVRLRQISLEQEGESLAKLRGEYAAYGEAVETIDRRITSNQVEQLRERTRNQKEQGGGRADALLNAGYLLPGAVGNAATNLGYLGQGGPTALALGGAAIAGIGAASGIQQVAKIAGEDEAALRRLQIAVENSGASFKAASGEIEEFVRVQTETTTFGREETVPAIEALVSGGLKYADALKVVRVAEDAAAGTGKPLLEITQQLLRAYEGQPRVLTSLGLANRDLTREGLSFADSLKLVEERFGGQATATDTNTAAQKQFQNAVRDLEAEIGGKLLGTLTDATRGATDFIKSLNGAQIGDAVAKNLDQIGAAIKFIGDQANAAKPFLDSLDKGLNDLQKDFEQSGRDAGKAVYGSTIGLAAAVDEYGNVTYGRGAQPPSAPPPASASVEDAITAASRARGVPASLLRAIGNQETGLGQSAFYDPITGTSRTPGNAGRGIFQLDPASGASAAELTRAATDVGFSADKAAKMIADDLKAANGNLAVALAPYHSGSPTAAGLAYARQVESQIPGYNPADTNVPDGQRIGGARAPSAFAQSLTGARANELAEQRAGIAAYRQDYINALQAIAEQQHAESQDETKSASEKATALKNYVEAEAKSTAEQRAQNSEATAGLRLAEQRLTLAERNADTARRAQQGVDPVGAFSREIGTLSGLQASRQAAGDQFSTRDVDALGAKIQALEAESAAVWERALSDAGKYYRNTSETLDEYIAKVRSLERGASTEEKTAGEAAITAAIEKSVSKTVTDLETEYKRAVENGLSRAGQEALARKDLGIIAATGNRGDATAADTLAGGAAQFTSDLKDSTGKDASQAVTDLSQKYKELATDISDSNAAEATKYAELASLTQSQIAELVGLGKQYQALGAAGVEAFTSIQEKIAELKVSENDQIEAAARAERDALQKRSEDYQKFADTASDRLATLFQNGTKGANGFRDAFKAALADAEHSLISNSIESTFFGVSGSTSPGDAFQKALFGAVDPLGKTGAGGPSQAALQKIANSPTGQTSDPLTVQLTPATTAALTGSTSGVSPGSDAAAAASGSGGLGSILGAGSGLGGLLGIGVGLASAIFGGGGTPSNQPDRTNTNAYGQTIANLTGSAGANGQNFYEDPATEKAFGGLSGVAGVERLLSFGPAAFTQQTGLSAAQYQQYLAMFGSSVTGSGTLTFNPNNIGQESVTGAAGAKGSYSYQQFATALSQIVGGIGTLGSTGPIDSYTFSRGYGNANQIGSPTSGLYLPTQVTGGPGYSGPNVSDITAGASQYGIVGGLLGVKGGSSLLGSLSTGAGVIGLLLGRRPRSKSR